MNYLLKGLEPNIKKILQSILTSNPDVVSLLHDDIQVFKIDKMKLISFLSKAKINYITFYDIDDGTRYSVSFKIKAEKNKTIEVLISELQYRTFKKIFYDSSINLNVNL